MTFRICNAVVALGCLLAAESARAHHNFNSVYDLAKRVTLTGTLTKIDWRNPHIELWIEVKGEQGQAESWVLQGHAPGKSDLLNKASFEKFIGQTVTVSISPARKSSLKGVMHTMTFPDGTTLVRK